MEAGADMAAVSMHKSGGSLTQSSLLLTGPEVHAGYVRQIINLTQTTSGSYLLMSSLDISRRNLALRGREVFHQVADMAEYAREEINAVGGYYAFGRELMNGDSVFDFDTTKLSVHTLDIGLAGIEVYDILRDEYDIQIEFGDIGNILAYLSMGDRPQEVERLVSALAEIRRRYQTDGTGLLSQEYIDPEVVTSPQEAFYADKISLPLRESRGQGVQRVCHVLSPGHPHPGPRRADHRARSWTISSTPKQGLQHDRPRGPGHPAPERAGMKGGNCYGNVVQRISYPGCQAQHPGGPAALLQAERLPAHRHLRDAGVRPGADAGRQRDADRAGRVHLRRDDHPCAHGGAPGIRDILVIGAGDGGVVRELTRYDRVERIDLVEMDPQVVEACRTYLPSNACRMDDRAGAHLL